MSIASKQMFLKELEENAKSRIIASVLDDFMKQASMMLDKYSIEFVGENGNQGKDYMRVFLDAKRIEGRAESTIHRYEYILSRVLDGINVPIKNVSTYHIRDYLTAMKNHGDADKTIESERSVINSFFGWLQREGLLDRNPCANVGAVKCAKKVRLPFSTTEIERLKESCEDVRDKAIICFLLSTGCRINEMCHVDRDDINFQTLECTVEGKGNKQRTVYIDSVTAMLLKRYFKTRDDLYPAAFIGKGTERIEPEGVRRMLQRTARKAGVDNVHPHRFRRTLATNLINRGMPIQEVSRILGHENINTTMMYVYIDQKQLKTSYQRYA